MKHPWSSQHFREGARAAGRPEAMIASAESAAAAIKRVHPDLPVVLTLHHLAHLSGVSAQELQEVTFRKVDAYRIFRVKKRGVSGVSPAPPRRPHGWSSRFPISMRAATTGVTWRKS